MQRVHRVHFKAGDLGRPTVVRTCTGHNGEDENQPYKTHDVPHGAKVIASAEKRVGIALIRSDAVQVNVAEALATIQLPSEGLGNNPAVLLVTYTSDETDTIAVSEQSHDAPHVPIGD